MENRKMNQSGGLEYKSVADATLSGGVLGGSINGLTALANGGSFWNGVRPGPGTVSLPGLHKEIGRPTHEPKLQIEKMKPMALPDEQMPNTIPNNTNAEGIKQIDLTLSPKQAGHYGNTAIPGKSILSEDPSELANGLNSDKYTVVRTAGDKVIVNFGKPIGNYYNYEGVLIGPSNYGAVIINGSGQIHIYPVNPIQW